jgi:hypothetical protein
MEEPITHLEARMIEGQLNLYSDTQTRPTPAMRQAMFEAKVGDEQKGLDPTVNRLCERVAELVGKEAAVLLPSGTMCNEIAVLVHRRPDAALARLWVDGVDLIPKTEWAHRKFDGVNKRGSENAEARTRKQFPGSLGARARLHENELWRCTGWYQRRDDRLSSCGG